MKTHVMYAQLNEYDADGWSMGTLPLEKWEDWGKTMEDTQFISEVELEEPSDEWLAQAGLEACHKAKMTAYDRYQEALDKIADQESKYLLLK